MLIARTVVGMRQLLRIVGCEGLNLVTRALSLSPARALGSFDNPGGGVLFPQVGGPW